MFKLISIKRSVQNIFRNFLGNSPVWYKYTILAFLFINPIIMLLESRFLGGSQMIIGWFVLFECVFTLVMTLNCYPLPPFSLIVIQAVIMGLTTPEQIYQELLLKFDVIMMLIFAIAPIYFHKNIINILFTKIITQTKSKTLLSIFFLTSTCILSAFLNALTVIAIIITISMDLYSIFIEYYRKIEGNRIGKDRLEKRQFMSFLRSILMHSVIGTVIGGTSTTVGEPQNFIISKLVNWNFIEFFIENAHSTISLLFTSIVLCVILEKYKLFGFGIKLPNDILDEIIRIQTSKIKNMGNKFRMRIFIEGVSILIFITLMILGVADIGLIGLATIGFITAFSGITKENKIGAAFEECLPFTALTILFLAVVGIIGNLNLFSPIISIALNLKEEAQLLYIYITSGVMSAISSNVFVATVFIEEIASAFNNNIISLDQFHSLAIVINISNNISALATPSGQEAILFLLISKISEKLSLNFSRMIYMTLPYTIVLMLVGIATTIFIK